MACLLRKGDWVELVARIDPCADQSGQASPDPDWLLATGQPAGCTRYRVTILTADEMTECLALSGQAESLLRAGALGFLAVNGEAVPFASLPDEYQLAIGLLVLVVTNNPLLGRRFRWMAPSAAAETLPESAPPSS